MKLESSHQVFAYTNAAEDNFPVAMLTMRIGLPHNGNSEGTSLTKGVLITRVQLEYPLSWAGLIDT